MVVLLKIIQVILALSLLVLFHEFGHYTFAKLFKTRVEKFYLFFNPKRSIIKFKRFNGKWHCKAFSPNDDPEWDAHPENTEYGIGWLPFGGYCKIAGMIDESMDTEAMKLPPQPYEFRTKKAWQRFFIMFGGVLFNFILAIILYAAILGTWGEEYLRNENAVYGIAVNDLSYEIGFRDGDRILAFDGVPTENFQNLQVDLVRSQAREATVLRGGDTVTVSIDPDYLPAMLNTPGMFDLAFPFVVKEVPADSPNAGAGLLPGDAFVGIDGERMSIVQQIQKELARHRSEEITASVSRAGDEFNLPLQVDTAGHVGVMLDTDLNKFFDVTTREYNLLTAVPAGARKTFTTIKGYVQELGLIFSPKTKAYKSVGSFIAIGRIFPDTWDWFKFWTLCALLSIMLGVMNLLPIPALDGGHILFLIFEMITGRRPSDKFMEVAEWIGMALLIMLMVLAFGNDIRSLF
ncbi:MAG: RIP metalloprotease RseP [Bacteroidales bacterium]|jgi:RIP metalloprotease RseP|nr:RIP metalloprotease RseP [Bacteroidales bacterium]